MFCGVVETRLIASLRISIVVPIVCIDAINRVYTTASIQQLRLYDRIRTTTASAIICKSTFQRVLPQRISPRRLSCR